MIPNISIGEGLTLSYLDGINCIAIGGTTKEATEGLRVLGVRQRAGSPSIIEIDFVATGNGQYEFVTNYCAFSLDSTNGVNGTWYILTPETLDSRHVGSPFNVAGTRTGIFVADMSSHMTTFLAETEIYVRLTIERTGDL